MARKSRHKRHVRISHSNHWYHCDYPGCSFSTKLYRSLVSYRLLVHLGSAKTYNSESCLKEFHLFSLQLSHECDVSDGSEDCSFMSKKRHRCQRCKRNFFNYRNYLLHYCLKNHKPKGTKLATACRSVVRIKLMNGKDCAYCFDQLKGKSHICAMQERHPEESSKPYHCDVCPVT